MRNENSSLGSLEHLLIGGLSGCIAKTAIAPFDRVKIHFQVATPEFRQYNSIFTMLVHRINQWNFLLCTQGV